MSDLIKCPVCGENNPADNEFCKNCQSRLQPLTGPLKDENAPLQPGQSPTKKVTSELEPILPQWLREARQQARQTDGDEEKLSAQEPPTTPASSAPDLLAGLALQSEDEEDAPDWLADITGNAPAKKKKTEQEDSNIKWVEIGGPDDFSEAPPNKENPAPAKPSWMTPQESAPEKNELASWLAEMGQSPASFTDEKAAPVQSAPSAPEVSPAPADQSDWLRNLQNDASTIDETSIDQTPIPGGETPDWLKDLNADAAFHAPESTQQAFVSGNETPDWLKNLDSSAALNEQKPAEKPAAQDQPASALDVPDWLRTFGESSAPSMPSASAANVSPSDEMMPDWLKAAAPSEEKPRVIPPEKSLGEVAPPAAEKMSDWLSALQPADSKIQESAGPALTPPESETSSAAPAFAEDSLSSGDMDEIFGSMQIPDWLTSAAAPSQPPASESLPPAAQPAGSIAPAELPSWVQAMRPVEAALPDAALGEAVNSGVEMNGPLAGLQGVLPVLPGGMKPTSRPKSHSIKLDASEEQQSHSALLEKILAEETAPATMKSPSLILSQRILRWVITAFLFLSVGGIFFSHSQIFTLPSRLPAPNDETEAAISAIDAVPAGAPVLAVFDYGPSLSGELEAAAAPLFNRLLLLKRPNLAIISTSPTGPALAEHFLSVTLKDRNYQRNAQYADIGYLAGGLAGVYDFAQNPAKVMPLGADGTLIWQSAILSGKTRLSDFAAVIVLTDSAEAGRVWIEQAGPFRDNALFVVVSSAQAGPMLTPYKQSAQINGLVSGLNSAAKIEQANGQSGIVRRYWDAYSLGLLLAAVFMTLGGLWNFILGLQARRAQEAK